MLESSQKWPTSCQKCERGDQFLIPKSQIFVKGGEIFESCGDSGFEILNRQPGGWTWMHKPESDHKRLNQKTPKNCLITASQSSNSVNTDPTGGNRPLRIFLRISPKIEKRQKLPHTSLPELKLRESGPDGGKSTLAHLLRCITQNQKMLKARFSDKIWFSVRSWFFCQKLDFLLKTGFVHKNHEKSWRNIRN